MNMKQPNQQKLQKKDSDVIFVLVRNSVLRLTQEQYQKFLESRDEWNY